MKKTLVFALGIAIAASSITSCKKGANDPGLSFKSRKARLSGEWTVSKSVMTESGKVSGVSYTETRTYENGKETTVYAANGLETSNETTVSQNDMTFEKDGTYKSVYAYDANGSTVTSTEEGLWAFLGKNKAEDLKNKEALTMTSTSSTVSGDGWSSTDVSTGISAAGVVYIDQLKSKEIILKGEYSYTPDGGDKTTYTYEITLTAK